MADLSLKINANFQDAADQFKKLSEESEFASEKIKKFSESFEDKKISEFIEKQKLSGAAMTATRGEIESLTARQSAYQREIERLIKAGLDPESASIKKLQGEYVNLGKEIENANEKTKSQEQVVKFAEKAFLAAAAAAAALGAAMIAGLQQTAEAGDEYAKTGRKVGLTAEAFQELEFAANMSGVETSTLTSSLEKLNKNVGDLQNGTGSLTSYLKTNNAELLNQLSSVNSNEEAFNLLMTEINKSPDEFQRAALAQAAFGKSGQDLILLASEGADGIAALRNEVRGYGIISNETAANSEKYLDAQARIQKALEGVRNEILGGLLPTITKSVEGVVNFISKVDNWDKILSTTVYALAGVTAGLGAFLVVTKGSAAIGILAAAFKALTAAIAGNPIGAIAVAITAILIPAIIYLVKNWDFVQTKLSDGIATLRFGFIYFGSIIAETFTVAFNSAKSAALGLLDLIQQKVLGGVQNFLDLLGKLPYVGEQFKSASDAVGRFSGNISNSIALIKQDSAEAIKAAKEKQDAVESWIVADTLARHEANEVRRQELNKVEKETGEIEKRVTSTIQEEETKRVEIIKQEAVKRSEILQDELSKRLEILALSDTQEQNQKIGQLQSFLEQRAELEGVSEENRLLFFEEQAAKLKELKVLNGEEEIALEKYISNEKLEIQKREEAERKALLMKQVVDAEALFGALADILQDYKGESRAAAIAWKAFAAAEAGIHSALAMAKALSSAPYPYNLLAMAKVGALGIAQQYKILSTPIPSAETGGRFIAPANSGISRTDGTLMRVNPGEEINVTPRGNVGSEDSQRFIFKVGEQVVFDIVNRGIKSGDIILGDANIGFA